MEWNLTPRYVKLEKIIEDKSKLPKSRAKPDVEINHAPNVESLWRTSTLKSLIQGYSTQVITQRNAG